MGRAESVLVAGQLGAFALTALSLALNLASVAAVSVRGQELPWEILALTTFTAFGVLAASDRYRLARLVAVGRGRSRIITQLTHLAAQLREVNAERGPRVYFFSDGGYDPREAAREERHRLEDQAIRDVEGRAREFLVAEGPEFINEWDKAGNTAGRLDVLDRAIQELRQGRP